MKLLQVPKAAYTSRYHHDEQQFKAAPLHSAHGVSAGAHVLIYLALYVKKAKPLYFSAKLNSRQNQLTFCDNC